jgi:hypothetical protein
MIPRFGRAALVGLLASASVLAAPASSQAPRLIAHYTLAGTLDDKSGNNPPMLAKGAPFQGGRAIFCNGVYALEPVNPCDVQTPVLNDMDLAAFTISTTFLVPRAAFLSSDVFVLGRGTRALSFDLQRGGHIRLGFNSNQFVACSVTYRIGVWHEATIVFDGTTTSLYLDGVKGCNTTVPLITRNEKVILLNNFGSGIAFYGYLRDLKIYNGAAIPARTTPVPDDMTPAADINLAPVDRILAQCPTKQDIASIDKDLKLSFESDDTAREPPACTAESGSTRLSPMRKRVYNTLLLMRQLQFDRPLPWTTQPLYRWFVGSVRGIRFRADIRNSSCCGPDRMLNIAAPNLATSFTDRWVEPAVHGGLDGFLLVLVHEARHADGLHPHTCGSKDQTLAELGSWGVQYYLARWLIEHTDQSFFSSGSINYNDQLARQADLLLRSSFCRQ